MAPQSLTSTQLLSNIVAGKPGSTERLLPIVYNELRALAASFMERERSGHTLQPTALAHEAYVRLVDQRNPAWESKAHFMSIAAQAMRRILVDHARARAASKRGGGNDHVTLSDSIGLTAAPAGDSTSILGVDVLALEEAMRQLGDRSERQARVAELRFYAGLSVRETAIALGIAERTVEADWRIAKAWLRMQLAGRKATSVDLSPARGDSLRPKTGFLAD
jgi:RNA polymerase sigma factor (TIGR02999 family)